MYKLLSYPLRMEAPGWPGNPTLSFDSAMSISGGDVCNTFNLHLFNHFGSHMDGPKHFNDNGPNLHQMPLETFISEKPLLLDVPKTFGELVTVADLLPLADCISHADLLLLRSGFSIERHRNPQRYAAEGVGLSAEACRYLIDGFPQLKAVAMDWISLASYVHGDDGMLAHQYLLGMFHKDRYICIIEDLNLENMLSDDLCRVFALPLFVEGIDSAPVTVLAELNDASGKGRGATHDGTYQGA